MIKNNNCNTNQTPKCKSNTDAVQIMSDQGKIDNTLTNIQTTLDSLKTALSDYCTEEGTNLDAISTKLSTIISLNLDCCEDINTKLGQLYDTIVAIPQYVESTSTSEEITTTVEQTTTSEELTTTNEDLPALKTCIDDALIYEGALSFTPPSVYYGGTYSFGSNIVEDSNYIFIAFNDSTDNEYKYHIIWRYNKTTEAIATKTITTTNSYCCDYHKVPAMIITSSGTLLVAIDQMRADNTHGAAMQIFRWADVSDLDTYSSTTVGNTTTERLSYPFLFEKGGNIILEAKNNNTSLPTRRYYTSNDDGATFGAITEYIAYGDSDYWIYAVQVGNNNLSDTILQIMPSYYTSVNIFQYVTFLKTDFTGNFYALDGTDLGTSVTGAELATYSSWGDTNKNTNYYINTFPKIFGNHIYLIGYIGTRIGGTLNISYMQIAKVNVNDGTVTTGSMFATLFPSSTTPSTALFNICDDIYNKISYDGTIYYYKIAEDLNSMELIYTEEKNYHAQLLTDLNTELTADYDTSTKTLRIFRMSDPDTVWNLTTTTAEPTTTIELPTTTAEITTTIEPVTTSEELTTTVEPTTTIEEGTTTAEEIDLSESLISCWGLDETSGVDVLDSYGNNDGTSYNCTINQAGAIDKAYDFNGTSSHVDIPSTDFRFNPLTESYSVSMWVKSADPSPTTSVVYFNNYHEGSGGRSYPWGWLIAPSDSNRIDMNIWNGSSAITVQISGADVWDGDWHLLIMVVDHSAGYSYAYVDTTLKDSAEITFGSYSPNLNTDTLYIASRGWSTDRFYDGLIDQMRVYNKALSINEISALFNSGSGVACPEGSTTTTEPTTTVEPTTTSEQLTTTEEPTTTEEVTTTSGG